MQKLVPLSKRLDLIQEAEEALRKAKMRPEAVQTGTDYQPFVTVSWGSGPGVKVEFPATDLEHALLIVAAINKEPWIS